MATSLTNNSLVVGSNSLTSSSLTLGGGTASLFTSAFGGTIICGPGQKVFSRPYPTRPGNSYTLPTLSVGSSASYYIGGKIILPVLSMLLVLGNT